MPDARTRTQPIFAEIELDAVHIFAIGDVEIEVALSFVPKNRSMAFSFWPGLRSRSTRP